MGKSIWNTWTFTPTGSDPVYSNSELPNSYANEAAVTDRLTAVTN